jgi:ribosomal protein S18 acetylase RimI-like enzyme
MAPLSVRNCEQGDLAQLSAIESSGDTKFAGIGIAFPPGPATIEGAITHGADVLVAGEPGEPPAGFAAIITLDGHPHLEQISVRADQGGRGTGSLLLEETVRRAGAGITLITYRDVPWNGPWYARHGFTELPEDSWGPELRARWQTEVDTGIHAFGPRLVMCHETGLA